MYALYGKLFRGQTCLNFHGEMISINSQHLTVNRIVMLTIGLWPYYQSKLTELQFILILIIETSFIFFQLATFANAELTFYFIMEVLSSVLSILSFMVSHIMFWTNIQNMKIFMEQLQQICNELTNEKEIAIVEEEGYNIKRFVIKATLCCIFSICVFNIASTWSYVLDVFMFINKSEHHYKKYIASEYFIDEDKYYYLILLHQNIALTIVFIGLLSTVTMLLAFIKYICAMFKIASYRIEQAMTKSMLKNTNLTSGITIYRKMILAVDIHRKAMRLSLFMISMFEIGMFVLTIITILNLSLNLFSMVSSKNNIAGFFLPFIRSFSLLFSVFILHYHGEKITDYSNHIFFTAYSVQSYKAPLKIQKLILFILQRGSKSFKLQVGGLFLLSINSFTRIANTSISYFTVMYSIQK